MEVCFNITFRYVYKENDRCIYIYYIYMYINMHIYIYIFDKFGYLCVNSYVSTNHNRPNRWQLPKLPNGKHLVPADWPSPRPGSKHPSKPTCLDGLLTSQQKRHTEKAFLHFDLSAILDCWRAFMTFMSALKHGKV